MAKILVCGGTGFVGSAIVKKLIDRHSVTILTRSAHPKNTIPGVEYVRGDISNISDIENAMKNCEVVINATQFDNAPFENPRKGKTYEKVDGDGTVNVVHAAKKMNISHILYISGAGVEEGKTENWFRAKLRAESAVRNSGIPYTIFRPSWVYGKNDRSLNRMIPMIRYSPVAFILGKGYRIQPIYIDDVANIVAKAIELSKAHNQVYELAGPESLTMKEILSTVARVLKKRRFYVHVPKSLAGIAFSILEKIPGSIITRAALDFITMNVVISEEEQKRIQNDFEISPLSLEKGLKTYL